MHACARRRAIDGNERQVRHEDCHADGERPEHGNVDDSLIPARVKHSKDGEHQQRSCYELRGDLRNARACTEREGERAATSHGVSARA